MENSIQAHLLGLVLAEEMREERRRKEIKLETEDPIGKLLRRMTRLFR